jgi:diguanylate cyclase (GGDEF)-like protein
MLAGLPLYAAVLAGAGDGIGLGSPDSWWPIACYGALATMCLGIRSAHARSGERLPWVLMTVALACWTVGWATWVVFFEGSANPPYPSVSDGFWVAWGPLTYAAIVVLIGRERPDLPRRGWLDGLVAACALGAIAAQILLPLVGPASGGFLAEATLVVYPASSIFLVALIGLVFGFRQWRPGPRWTLFALAVVFQLSADMLWAWGVTAKTWTDGQLPDVLYAMCATALVGAAWVKPRDAAPHPASRRLTLFPAGFALAAVGLLAYGNRGEPLVLPAFVLAVAATVAGMARWAIAVRRETKVSLLDRLAHTDDLLDIPNRRSLLKTLDDLVRQPRPQPFALVVFDLDRFKELNATLGHGAGDDVLRAVSARAACALPAGATFARVAGDQFAAVLPDCRQAQAVGAATAILHALGEPMRYEEMDLALEASVGIALHPEHGSSGPELLRTAEAAMFQAKDEGGGGCWELYAPTSDRSSRESLSRLSRVRTAIEDGRLVVHYQPQVDLRTGEVVGAEALARLQDAERGLLYPHQFLPAVESSGLMRILLLAMLEDAIAACRSWVGDGGPGRVSVNLSPRNLLDERLAQDVAESLDRHGLAPHRLCLEITEHVMMLDRARSERTLGALRETGVQVALDDFGVGHSSLAQVRRLPIDEIKVDRSFVAAMATSRPDAVIVRSAIDLAQALGVRMVAEGVEDGATAAMLRAQGCMLAQGYLFGRPAPVLASQVSVPLLAQRK